MFKTLQATFPRDIDLPLRAYTIAMLRRVVDGTLYDALPYAFHEEKNQAQEYVPLRSRRPSVQYGLCSLVVNDSVSLLFSEGHFPDIDCEDEPTRDALRNLVKEIKLNGVMIDAATRGSVGSVAIYLRVMEGRVFIDARNTEYLTPTWNPKAPDTLIRVREQYKVNGKQLKDAGYAGAFEDQQMFWLRTDWDAQFETAYFPVKVVRPPAAGATPNDPPPDPFVIDESRTVRHALGFVPIVWVRNLPGGDDIDGRPTFPPAAIQTGIKIDYLLSQGARGLEYASDPTLLIKEPAAAEGGTIIRGAANALVVSEKGDAKLLEIGGTASEAVIEFVRAMRELALETMHGNRSNADKVSAAQSGRAVELLHQSLIWLADKLRISYGEGALYDLLVMIVRASNVYPLVLKNGDKIAPMNAKALLSLRWPAWFAPTLSDKLEQATALGSLVDHSIMSPETATEKISDNYDIEDIDAELQKIEAQRVRVAAEANAQVKINA